MKVLFAKGNPNLQNGGNYLKITTNKRITKPHTPGYSRELSKSQGYSRELSQSKIQGHRSFRARNKELLCFRNLSKL